MKKLFKRDLIKTPMSFPRKRESRPGGWIPAFAGMTKAWRLLVRRFLNNRFIRLGEGIAVLAIASVLFLNCGPRPAPLTPVHIPNTYDTAVSILRDFVRGGDYGLGFKDTNGLAEARLDTSEVLRLGYELNDSLLMAGGLDSAQIADMHRKLYPVYAQGKLHSAIMFDSTPNGWRPVRFANGDEIRHYLLFKKHDPRAAGGCEIVISNATQSDYMIATSKSGVKTIVLPIQTRNRLREYQVSAQRDSSAISVAAFIQARRAFFLAGK